MVVHAPPVGLHATVAHVIAPPHRPEQQSPLAVHATPSPRHGGGPHVPVLQLPEQQSVGNVHVRPGPRQPTLPSDAPVSDDMPIGTAKQNVPAPVASMRQTPSTAQSFAAAHGVTHVSSRHWRVHAQLCVAGAEAQPTSMSIEHEPVPSCSR